jgi:hypothetical protein
MKFGTIQEREWRLNNQDVGNISDTIKSRSLKLRLDKSRKKASAGGKNKSIL